MNRSVLHQSGPFSLTQILCPWKLHQRQVTGGVLGQSLLPFCSQVPCWILKDCMMRKFALQTTYRSMQFLILPRALHSSLKSQLIACSLTFHKWRGGLRALQKPKPNVTFYSRVFGEEEEKGSGCFSKSNSNGFSG